MIRLFLVYAYVLFLNSTAGNIEEVSFKYEESNLLEGVKVDSIGVFTDSLVVKMAKANRSKVIAKVFRPGMLPKYSGFDGRTQKWVTRFDSVVEIGSCTKMFIATSILQLVEKGKLSLQSKVIDLLGKDSLLNKSHLIGGVNYVDSIRVYQLLNHSSGLHDYFVAGSDEDEIALHGDSSLRFTFKQLLEMAQKSPPYFKPGGGFQYSNTNYILLGMIIEKIAGVRYQSYVQKNVLDPLGMNSTYFASQKSPKKRVAGHYGGKTVTMPATLAGPAGEILSTLDDMELFLEGWNTGKLFVNTSTKLLLRSAFYLPMSGATIQYGLGVIQLNGNSFGHAGQTFGSQFYASSVGSSAGFVISADDATVSVWEAAIVLSAQLNR